jgi:hypothetical protein
MISTRREWLHRVETGKFDQSDIEWRQLVEIVPTPALPGPVSPPVMGEIP